MAHRALRRLPKLLGAAGWGVCDQALLSVANFLTLFLLARSVHPDAFGVFSLVYGVMLLANYGQLAFITQPHNVIAATLHGSEYRLHTRSLLVVQLWMSLFLAVASGCVAFVAYELGSSFTPLIIAVIPTLPLWQLQEFFRRVLYTERRQAAAFGNDVLSYGVQGAGVAALAAAGFLTAPAAFYAAAATSAAGCLLGFAQIRESVRGSHFSRRAFVEGVSFGKWLAASIAAHWTSTQAYLYIAAALLGAAVTGALRALQLVLAPLHVLMFSLSTMLPIRLSASLADPSKAAQLGFRRDARIAFQITFPIVGAYCLFVAVFAKSILRHAYGSKYSQYSHVLAIFGGYYLLLYLGQFAGALLTARRRTDLLFLGNAAAALVAVIAAWPLIHAFGAEGAAFLLTLSAGVLTVALWHPWSGAVVPAVVDSEDGSAEPSTGK